MKLLLKMVSFLFAMNLVAADATVPAYVIITDDSREIPARSWVTEVRSEVLSRWKGMTQDQQSQALKKGYTYNIHNTNIEVTGPNFERTFDVGEEVMMLEPGNYKLSWRERFSCQIKGTNIRYSNTRNLSQTFEARQGSTVTVTVKSDSSPQVTYQ
jgi:hypothetical protein